MVQARVPSRAELLEDLRESGREVRQKVERLTDEDLAQGRYENGWTARQILAHVASIEWTYPRLFELAREGTPLAPGEPAPEVRRSEPREAPGVPTRPIQGGIDAYNQRQVDKRAGASPAELLEEFRRNRAATIAAVEAADEALLTTPVRSAGGITGAVASVLHAVAVEHVRGHLSDILGTRSSGR